MKKDMYAIFGFAKLKTSSNIQGVIEHMTRQRYTPNADNRENDVLINPPPLPELEEELALYRPRRNAVLAYDVLLAASPEWFVGRAEWEIQEWERASLQWACDTFGRDNVKGCIGHRSETTPHLQLIVIPEHQGRLCASHYTGTRQKLRDLWTSYGAAMKRFGLMRGQEYSIADHKDIKSYYADVAEGDRLAKKIKVNPEHLPSPGLLDRADPKGYAAKMANMAVQRLAEENGNLRAALNAERRERKKIERKATEDRQLYYRAKENPDFIRKLMKELEEERAKANEYGERYAALVSGVRTFFDRNIGQHSLLRLPKNLGSLQCFPELHDAIRISMSPDFKPRQGMELTM